VLTALAAAMAAFMSTAPASSAAIARRGDTGSAAWEDSTLDTHIR
jgi:hypothetical protein